MQKKEVKAVLFDLDGVLVDSLDAWFYVFNDALKSFGFKAVSKKRFIKDFGAPIEQDIKKYFKGKTIEQVKCEYNKKFGKRSRRVKLFAQSVYVLKKLKKQGIKLALITNSSRAIVSKTLKRFKLKKYFDVIVTMDDVKRRKPAPDMALRACRILNVDAKDAIMIGDTKNDMLAGKSAGCITVGYKIKGDYKINSLDEIFSLIGN